MGALWIWGVVASVSGLSIEVASPQRTVLVGEPVKLVVKWKAGVAGIKGLYVEDDDFQAQSLMFLVRDGTRMDTYRESRKALTEHISGTTDLPPGGEVMSNLVLSRGGFGRGTLPLAPGLLFGKAGEYSLRAAYAMGGARVESNALTFVVAEPSGGDKEVLAAVREWPFLLEAAGSAESQAKLKQLLVRHKESAYLRWPRVLLARERGAAIENGLDPETGERLFVSNRSQREEVKAERFRELARELLSEEDWGVFEEEALSLALSYATAGNDEESANEAKRALLDRHADSVAVRAMEQ